MDRAERCVWESSWGGGIAVHATNPSSLTPVFLLFHLVSTPLIMLTHPQFETTYYPDQTPMSLGMAKIRSLLLLECLIEIPCWRLLYPRPLSQLFNF